jgi:hypothetical protein
VFKLYDASYKVLRWLSKRPRWVIRAAKGWSVCPSAPSWPVTMVQFVIY